MSLLLQHELLKDQGPWNCYIYYVLHALKRLRSDDRDATMILSCVDLLFNLDPSMCTITMYIDVHFGSNSMRI